MKFGLEGLQLAERGDTEAGVGQVRVRINACSLNYRDWMMAMGTYNPRQRLPLIPLSDGVGIVEAVGENVTRVAVGDRVAAIFSQGWIGGAPTRERTRATLGGPLDGMLRGYAVFDAESVVRVPGHLTDEEAASLPCAGVTAWNALITQGNVQPGDVVVVQGTGGVSIFALQFARMAGAQVIVTSSSDEKLARARELGAWATINYVEHPDWDRQVRQLTGGIGADHIIEVGGAGTLARSLKAIRIGGTISVIGVLGGSAVEVLLTPILMQNVRLQGVMVGSRDIFESMNRAIETNEMRPVVDRVFGFEEAVGAFDYLAAGRHFGKVCIRVA